MCSMLDARDPSFRAADERKMATKNAPRTVKDVPAQEFVIALAQYFRSTGKVREESNARRRSRIVARSSDDARARTARRWTIERDDVGGDECERIRAHRSSSRETTRGRLGVDEGARRGRRVER
jgi:hypothetical protein